MNKLIKINWLVIVVLVFGLAWVSNVRAAENDNIFGWAWNPTAGWISFNNCVYGGDCNSFDYGVSLDEQSYNLSGYAWNNNVGWIKFDDSYPQGGYPQYSAQFDPVTRRFSGWVHVLSLGVDGWIKLAKHTNDSGPDYYVHLLDDGKLAGWAWSNKLGWISFNSVDWLDNTITYYVTGQAPMVPTGILVEVDEFNGCNTLNISWNEAKYASSYSVYRGMEPNFALTDEQVVMIGATLEDILHKSDNNLELNTVYYYHVEASNFFGKTASLLTNFAKTKWSCEVSNVVGQGDCLSGNPSVIKLSWQAPIIAQGTSISHYNILRCQVTDTESCLQVSSPFQGLSGGDCYNVEPDELDDPMAGIERSPHCTGDQCHCWERFYDEEVANQYVYEIIAINSDGDLGDPTGASSKIQIFPCARQRSWLWEEQNPLDN